MLQLVRVHNRSDGLNSTIDDIEFDDADETILRVQEYRTRLAVHIYSSEPAADGLALGKDAVNQSRHAIPSGHRVRHGGRSASSVSIEHGIIGQQVDQIFQVAALTSS